MTSFKCKKCDKDFKSRRGLHLHLGKTHEISVKQYYEMYEPRYNLLNGNKLKFNPSRGYDDYASKDFANRGQLNKWCEITDPETVRPYIVSLFKKYIKKHGAEVAPCSIDFELSKNLPSMEICERLIGYRKLTEECGIPTMFDYSAPPLKAQTSKTSIFVDTREQKPFVFHDESKTIRHKLDIGDYCLAGEAFNKIFIERKGESDFKNTLSNQIERFEKEIIRCRDLGTYMFVVVESTIPKIIKNNIWGHKTNLDWVFHNTRKIQRDYHDCCQFVFTENRASAAKATRFLLEFGPQLKNQDINLNYNW